MAKPCRNSRWVGPPTNIGSSITSREFELLPDYGRASLSARTVNGFNPDMQTIQYEMQFTVPSPEGLRRLTNPSNPRCPLSRFVGNTRAKERLSRAVYAAYGRQNHCCSDQSFALLGPSSSGKTTLARLFGEAVMLPFVEIQPHAVRDSRDLFQAIAVKLENTVVNFPDGPASLKMVTEEDDPTMLVPPCVVFIDEVHALSRNLIPELLKATEPSDGMMHIENGWYADCRQVCWIIATTERGLLFPAFDSRFRKIQLEMYGAEEIAAIVQLHHPTWNLSQCRPAAQYGGRVPRDALAFAADMELELEQNGGNDWEAIATKVAKSHGIDRYGLTRQRLTILVALGQIGPVSKERMCEFAQCRIEELEKFVMPALLVATAREPALAAVTSRGYQITWQGISELERRGIPHRGKAVVVGGHEKLDFGSWDSGCGNRQPTTVKTLDLREIHSKGLRQSLGKLAKRRGWEVI